MTEASEETEELCGPFRRERSSSSRKEGVLAKGLVGLKGRLACLHTHPQAKRGPTVSGTTQGRGGRRGEGTGLSVSWGQSFSLGR